MDADERFVFTLDGQLATLEDYLEIRPEAEGRVRQLVEAGRLAIGPWQTLMDEFLVSGETLVRNLETGMRRAEELGGSLAAGYLPDMFGHCAQMPQILRRAGIGHALVWRGVPAAISTSAFRWEAPDGSSVRAEYMPHGYWGAAYVLSVPDRLAEKIEVLDQALRPFFGERPLLAMYGTDHSEPLPQLVELVERLNVTQSRYDVQLTTLAGYVQAVEAAGSESALPRWRGELRSGARANMLMGVTSARIDLKAACARAERLLERYAEPLQALHSASPERFLELAWRRLLENSAHDSICGCSSDEVCRQVLVRYDEAEQIARGLAEEAAGRVAATVPAGSFVALNPSPSPRAGMVELDCVVPEEWHGVSIELPGGTLVGTQEVGRSRAVLLEQTLPGGEVAAAMHNRMHGRELYGLLLNGIETGKGPDGRGVTFHVGPEPDPLWLDVDESMRLLELETKAYPDQPWSVRILGAPRRTLLASVPAPPLGAVALRPRKGVAPVEAPVEAAGSALRNGLLEVRVEVDGALGLLAEGRSLRGVGRLVDGGDAGDTYNYAPPPQDAVVDEPLEVSVELRRAGPVRGELAIRRLYRWPLRLAADCTARSGETALVPVTTTVELRTGEPFLRLRIAFANPCSDHRLRLHIPLARRAEVSAAEGQFAVVERGLEAEGGYGETPVPTFPASGFVDAGGVAVLLLHPLEYELVDGRELALTVLRSTGLISRNRHPWRVDPAGPEIPVPDAQCRRDWQIELALLPHGGTWDQAGVLTQLERFRHPFLTARGTASGEARELPRGLELRGENVTLSALRRRGEPLELRLACESPSSQLAELVGGFQEAWEVDLLGRQASSLPLEGGTLRVELEPWELRTFQLTR